MKTLGHPPAVFFGQDQRRKQDQMRPVIVYAFDSVDTISTDDDDVVMDEVYTVQVSSRTASAESERSAIVRRILERSRKSDEMQVVPGEADRDDDLEMSFQEVEITIPPYDSDDPFVHTPEELLWGPDGDLLTWGGDALTW